MGGKAPQAGTPTTSSRVAGPPVLQKNLGPRIAGMRQSQDQFRDTAANVVGSVANIVSNIFVPGTGGLAQIAANRTVREQVNLINGRPVLESTEEPLKDWPTIVGGTVGGYAGGAAGQAAGGAVAGATGSQVGGAVGSQVGGYAGAYGGQRLKAALYGPTTRAQQIGDILGRLLASRGGVYGQLGATRSQSGYGG